MVSTTDAGQTTPLSGPAVTLTFLDDDAPTPRALSVTPDLAAAIARAAVVTAGKDAFAVTFDSLLIGLVATPDSTGDWIRRQFGASHGDLDALLRRRGLDRSALARLTDYGPSASPGSSVAGQPFTRTSSARQALEEAERQARADGAVTGTGHVLSALISLPGLDDSDFEGFDVRPDLWRVEWQSRAPHAREEAPDAGPGFDLTAPGVEHHVVEALRWAEGLAGSGPISPEHVITAIVRLSERIRSEAFMRAAQLLPLPAAFALGVQGQLPDATRFHPDLLRHLQRAQRPKPGTTAPSAVWGRDLVTAALLCPDELVAPCVTASGQSLDWVRDLWYVFVTGTGKHRDTGDWSAWWRDAHVPLPGPRRAGYATETDRGDDKLGVEAEAQAFARLILDRAVEAPLSIGLLGDWGSGKSFFIEQIKKAIRTLRTEGRPELYEHVVEIEFNAWHASDSNLWASLVTNIFDEIWANVSAKDATKDAKQAQEALQKQIEQARGAVHEAETQVQLGRQALETAERELEEKRTALAWDRYVASYSVETLTRIAKSAGWHESIATINDVEQAARALTTSGTRLRMMAAALAEKPIQRIALPTAALIVVTAAAWLVVETRNLNEIADGLAKVLATVAGAVSALAVPLRLARQKVDALSNGLQSIQAEYDRKLEAVRNDPQGNEQTRAHAEEVMRARRELESTEASVVAARAKLAELMNQQATLDPLRRLGAFLEERVRSTQYRSQQGIISLVHKDFSELSKFMKQLRESKVGANGAIRPFDRVVLYVDDLDRCRPAHVVNMLEAVHLLLALDLFVVVVAVDSRWLTRALEVHYQDLLTASDAADNDGLRASTPQSYLEKIFQITYALGPMDPTRFRDYVAFLAGAEEDQQKRTVTTGATEGRGEQEGKNPSGGTDTGEASTAAKRQHQQGAAGHGPPTQHPTPTPDQSAAPPKPKGSAAVFISKPEREFITTLVPLLPTPRIAKRLVNVYRVIKATKTTEELEMLERDGQFRTCLLMLAILFGRPAIAGPLLRALHERTPPFDQPNETLVAALRRRTPPAAEPAAVGEQWRKLIATLATLGVTDTVASCAQQAKQVARYSLVSGHDWHTWSEPRDKS